MSSKLKKLSVDLDGRDDSLGREGAESELSLAEDSEDFLEVFNGTLTFGGQSRYTSLNFETDLPNEHDDVNGPVRVAFEISNANIIKDGRNKYVAYSILVLKGGGIKSAEVTVERRYSDFERLYINMKHQYPTEMRDIAFPKKILTGNFKAETIAQRSRAFEQFLGHVYSVSALKVSSEFIHFLYYSELSDAYDHIRNTQYKKSISKLKTALVIQQKLQGETHSEVFATQCALIAVYATLDQEMAAQLHAETALQCVTDDNNSPYLASLLQLSIRLCWKLGKDKKDLEMRQHKLKLKGVDVDSAPPLITVVHQQIG